MKGGELEKEKEREREPISQFLSIEHWKIEEMGESKKDVRGGGGRVVLQRLTAATRISVEMND